MPMNLDNREQSAIELRDVSFAYEPSRPVVNDFNLGVSAGEFFVLLGPSGCGKTTVMDLIAGFVRPTGGTVRVGGKPIEKPGTDRVVVFQGDSSLLGWKNVVGNIEFGLSLARVPKAERRSRTARALETVSLVGHESKYPRELSGGMKQRVQIARALVSDASVMLMDEPFGALDAMTRTALQDEVSRIWEQNSRTVLFITHDISEAIILADRIGVMGKSPAGKLISVVDNDLPRPRSRGTEGFAHKYSEIEAALSQSFLEPSDDKDSMEGALSADHSEPLDPSRSA